MDSTRTRVPGFLRYAWVHGADLQDARGAEIVLENGLAEAPTLTLVWVDGGYDKLHLRTWAADNTTVTLEVVRRPEGARGFVLLPRRWVVERTFAWLSRYRRLAKDYERLIENSTAWLYLASIHTLTRRSAKLDAESNTDVCNKAA